MTERYTHAGGVVFRGPDGAREYLLVRASSGADWVLPKGHIDPGETPEVAAAREVAEEASVHADVVAPLCSDRFERGGETVSVLYFLMRYRTRAPPGEDRELCWLPLAEARARVRWPALRDALEKAHASA